MSMELPAASFYLLIFWHLLYSRFVQKTLLQFWTFENKKSLLVTPSSSSQSDAIKAFHIKYKWFYIRLLRILQIDFVTRRHFFSLLKNTSNRVKLLKNSC